MKAALRSALAILVLSAVMPWTGCGYRLAGRADLLPKHIRTISVPAFANATIRYKLTDRLALAVTREFLSRTRYQVVPEPGQSDAIFEGTVVSFVAYPIIFDPATVRASSVQVSVAVAVTLRDRASGAVLFSRQRVEFRERYEISADQQAYFEESDAALERLSSDVARTLVSAVLENF